MQSGVLKNLFALMVLVLIGMSLSSCGRKGPLEPPPSATITDEEKPANKNEVPDRPFILDGLL